MREKVYIANSWRIFLLGFLVITPAVVCLDVLQIDGPKSVENGSIPLLILDCDYDVTEEDLVGLVIKWYFNKRPFPVYQWIPHHNPQGLGILEGRLDLEYQVSDSEYKKHRALAIINPTTELSGEYHCWASSFTEEDHAKLSLVVYVPPSEMKLSVSETTEDSFNITCNAGCTFPEPKMAFYKSLPNSNSRTEMMGAWIQKDFVAEENCYNMSVEIEVYEDGLDTEVLFECELSIPGSDYEMSDRFEYVPEPPTTTTTSTTTTTTTTSTTTTAPPTTAPDYEVEEEIVEEIIDDKESEKETKESKPHVAESVSGGSQMTPGRLALVLTLGSLFLRRVVH